MVIVGTTLIAATPFIYIFADNVWWFIFAQVIYGIGGGLAYPAWFSLFASNLDKGQQGFEWAVYSGAVGVSVAAAAYAGSWIANVWGFNWVFLLTGLFSLVGMIILLGLEKDNLKKILPSEMFVSKHKPVH
jgi:DHA1 family quinolone resistance protein-like MFS transporter